MTDQNPDRQEPVLEQDVPPEQWASDGDAVIAGVEDVDQDPELFTSDDVVEIYVEPEA